MKRPSLPCCVRQSIAVTDVDDSIYHYHSHNSSALATIATMHTNYSLVLLSLGLQQSS